MEFFWIIFLMISGVTISSSLIRRFFVLSYDWVIIRSIFTIYSGFLISLLFFLSLGIKGIFFSLIFSIVTPFIGVNKIPDRKNHNDEKILWGVVYWFLLFMYFIFVCYKSGQIFLYLSKAYPTYDVFHLFSIFFMLEVLICLISLTMFTRELSVLLMSNDKFKKIRSLVNK